MSEKGPKVCGCNSQRKKTGAGVAIGAVIGTAVAGPVGTVVGGIVGGITGCSIAYEDCKEKHKNNRKD